MLFRSVRALIRIVLISYAMSNRHALLNIQCELINLAHNPRAIAHRAFMFDNFPLTTAMIAADLHLLEDPRSEHVFPDDNSMAVALSANIQLLITCASPIAFVANLLLLEMKLCFLPIVEVPQGYGDANFHIWSSALAVASEAAAATTAKKSGE